MKDIKNQKPALILIDMQKGFEDIAYWGGNRNNLKAEENAAKILSKWRQKKWPVFHVKHCSSNPESKLAEGKIGNDFMDCVAPLKTETVIKKDVNSAFIGTNLKHLLDEQKISSLVFVGLTTDHCVSTSVRMAGNFAFNTTVVSDATATFDKKGVDGQHFSAELIHDTALASLNQEFATVQTTESVLKNID